MSTTLATATTTPTACQPLEGALRIPVTLIEPSPLNPRKLWKADRVTSMAAKLKARGQIQPIRVRPNPRHTGSNGRPPYEIVVGETRWRAAPEAGLTMLDAVVFQCADQELIETALAENMERNDLNALEEADAYDALLRKPEGLQGYATVHELATAVKVSSSHVYQRLKLRALCPAGREAFLAGQIDASVALLIARMPNAEEQARATAKIVAGFGGEPYSYRSAAEYLRREFMLRLDLARFDTSAAYKVAGPCAGCPKRSGAAPDLFADVAGGGDMCQDARCYQAKQEEAHQALLQAARDAGRTVLQGSKARAVLRDPSATPVGHYRLDAPCPQLTDSARPLRALLGQGFAASIVVVDLGDSMPIELVPEEAAKKAIKARGLLRQQTVKAAPAATAPSPAAKPAAPLFAPKATAAPAAGRGTSKGERGEDLGEAKPGAQAGGGEEAQPMTVAQWEAGCRATARSMFRWMLAEAISTRLRSAEQLSIEILVAACEHLFDPISHEACALVFRCMAWDREPNIPYGQAFDRQIRLLRGDTVNGGRRLGELLALLVMAEQLTEDINDPADIDPGSTTDTITRALAVVPSAVMYEALDKAKQEMPPRPGKGRSGSAAASGGRELDATETFVRAHKPAGKPAGEVTDKASGPSTEQADKAWPFPKDHI